MLNKINKILVLALVMIFSGSGIYLYSDISEKAKKDEVQRTYNSTRDLQRNTVSNIDFYNTNYGIFGYNVAQSVGGGYWPRGSSNQYIFAGGVWFAAQKNHGSDSLRKYCSITYNPNNGKSWMVPGRIDDGLTEMKDKYLDYRVYFSTDFSKSDGVPYDEADGANWPIWDASTSISDTLKSNRYFGYYIYNTEARDDINYPKGPAFISQEDIFTTFKDTDLENYDGGAGLRADRGYPLKLQFENTIYSWGFGDYKDFIFLRYDIQNKSKDTLYNCWLAPVLDIDIALRTNSRNGASNDRVDYYRWEDSLNLAYQWTNTDVGEAGKGFGYLGFDFLESPAVKKCEGLIQTTIDGVYGEYCWQCSNWELVDGVKVCPDTIFFKKNEADFVRKDKRAYQNSEQLGLVTFRNWPISDDRQEDVERYDFISAKTKDGDNGPGDKRFMMATGPFNILPGDTVRTVYAIILASPAIKADADGSYEDLAELVRKDKFAQLVYDNNFRAPAPPDECFIMSYLPLNNAVKIHWDSLSEMSSDKYESGLGFLGYRIYRARNTKLDTFDVDQISPNLKYSSGKGPYGWKEIASFQMPSAFLKSQEFRAGTDPDDENMPYIDSLLIVGPAYYEDGTFDNMSISVLRVANGVNFFSLDQLVEEDGTTPRAIMNPKKGMKERIFLYPAINNIDTFAYRRPWGPYYASKFKDSDIDYQYFETPIEYSNGSKDTSYYPMMYVKNPFDGTAKKHFLIDSIMLGTIQLNSALMQYNPLYTKLQTVVKEVKDTVILPDAENDTIYLKDTYKEVIIDGVKKLTIDRLIPYTAEQAMKDIVHLRWVHRKINEYIQQGFVKSIKFPKMELSDEIKTEVINPYMKLITNDRTFIDIGDDNNDGVITYDEDIAKTEKLINSIDYSYKVLAFDEGDYLQKTPMKLNPAIKGKNYIPTYPKASNAGKKAEFKIISESKDSLGGLYNFRFFAVDQDRVNQLFAGHKLELTMEPYWYQYSTTYLQSDHYFGLYYTRLKLKDLTSNIDLYDGIFGYEPQLCDYSFQQHPTEDGAIYNLCDSVVTDTITGKEITFGLPNNTEEIVRSGKFTTGDFTVDNYCYATPFNENGPGFGTLGFSFDYTIRQQGGVFRPYSTEKLSGDAWTNVSYVHANEYRTEVYDNAQVTQWAYDDTLYRFFGNNYYTNPRYASYNVGPGDYEVTFKDGGSELMDLTYKKGASKATFNVPYLTYEVKYVSKFNRSNGGSDSVECSYPSQIEFMELPENYVTASVNLPQSMNYIIQRYVPDPRNLGRNWMDFIHRYNSSSYGWVDTKTWGFGIQNALTWETSSPYAGDVTKFTTVGTQGRYYLSAKSTDGAHDIDFVNILNISGCQFAFDFVGKGKRHPYDNEANANWEDKTDNRPDTPVDFKPGDKVRLSVRGGVLGLPMPKSKIVCEVTESVVADNQLTDDDLEQVRIVPNPYYLTHLGQRTPNDAKLYFTKLPPKCTIEIYTETGNLVKTIEHNEALMDSDFPDKEAVEVWNLMSSNGLRVASQPLIALIKTPNGSQTIKNFTVIVGGSRIVQEED